jgi:hypothetical protein
MSKQSTASPIDDLTFDVITVLREKAKALAAYDKYLGDADADDDDELHELFVSMRKQDEEHVQVLKEVLARRLEDDLGYDESDDEDVEDDDLGDDDVLGEDYDEADEEEVEEPSSSDASSSAGANRGEDAGAPPTSSPPKRGESAQRGR